jgi:hypothetical protein
MLWMNMLASSSDCDLRDGGAGSFGELVSCGPHSSVTQETVWRCE